MPEPVLAMITVSSLKAMALEALIASSWDSTRRAGSISYQCELWLEWCSSRTLEQSCGHFKYAIEVSSNVKGREGANHEES
jgi:hypothetical protein